jgi:hypothetical protein
VAKAALPIGTLKLAAMLRSTKAMMKQSKSVQRPAQIDGEDYMNRLADRPVSRV